MREKNKRISFALRSQLSNLQELCGGKMKHKAYCKAKRNNVHFDLIRIFKVSEEIKVSLFIKEDLMETKKAVFLKIEKDLSNNVDFLSNKDLNWSNHLIMETKFIDYEELKDILNLWSSSSKEDLIAELNKRLPI